MDASAAPSASALRATHERFVMSPHRTPPPGVRRLVAESWQRCAAGRTRVIAEPRRLDQVNDSFDEVLDGRAEARLVFEF